MKIGKQIIPVLAKEMFPTSKNPVTQLLRDFHKKFFVEGITVEQLISDHGYAVSDKPLKCLIREFLGGQKLVDLSYRRSIGILIRPENRNRLFYKEYSIKRRTFADDECLNTDRWSIYWKDKILYDNRLPLIQIHSVFKNLYPEAQSGKELYEHIYFLSRKNFPKVLELLAPEEVHKPDWKK